MGDIVKILKEFRTNLYDRTSVLYNLTPQVVNSLVYYSTGLVDYTGQVGERMGIERVDEWWGPNSAEKIEHRSIYRLAQNNSPTRPSTVRVDDTGIYLAKCTALAEHLVGVTGP